MDHGTERSSAGNSPEALRADAQEIANTHAGISSYWDGETVTVLTREPNWTRAAAEFGLSATMWHALADSSRDYARHEYGHLAGDFGEQISALYRRMATIAESFQDQARAIAYAQAHLSCEGDCDLEPCAGGA